MMNRVQGQIRIMPIGYYHFYTNDRCFFLWFVFMSRSAELTTTYTYHMIVHFDRMKSTVGMGRTHVLIRTQCNSKLMTFIDI